MNTSSGRELPAGWLESPLTDNPLTHVISPGIEQFEGNKRYLATADVNESHVSQGTETTFHNRPGRANMQPAKNSVWFAKMKGSIKHLFLNEAASELTETAILSTGFFGLQCSDNSFSYIAAMVSHPRFELLKDYYSNGATQQSVSNADLANFMITIPDERTLELFSNQTSDVFRMLNAKAIENRKLIELRDWLLPLLMNEQAVIQLEPRPDQL